MKIEQLTLADAAVLYKWIREDQAGELGKFLPFLKAIQSVQDEERFLTKMLSLDTVRMWTIQTDNNEVIGEILLHSYNRQKSTAKLGYWLAKPFRQQGYTSEALRVLMQECHEINTFIIEVEQSNQASQYTAQKAGFQLMGVQPNDEGQLECIYEWQRSF